MANIEANKLRIAQVLSSFKIGHEDINVTIGPSVTLYEFKAQIGVRMSKIRNLKDEFTAALGAGSVRVIAPIPERGTVGIEVPNSDRENIDMIEMLYTKEYMDSTMELPLVMGKKVDNSVFITDLATMPHLLVAGATGMGKSVGLNVIISSLINKRRPEELKLVLIDPKQVELTVYEKIAKPYIAKLTDDSEPIITDEVKAQEVLDAVIDIMEERYSMLKDMNVRNLMEYNAAAIKKLPYIVVIIDEFGDLIMQSKGTAMERAICRIAQKARAVGIHMIISTQRPSTDIITGRIKANFPTRIAFRTVTGTDSRVILDRNGAEKLAGRGDMLFYNGGDTTRCQCAYISTDEVLEMCQEIKDEFGDCEQAVLKSYASVTPMNMFTEVMPETRGWCEVLHKMRYCARCMEDYYAAIPKGSFDMVVPQLQEMGLISTTWRHGWGYEVLYNEYGEIQHIVNTFYND